MVVWYTIALTQGIWVMAAFGVIHLGVGVGLTWYTLAGFLNTTYINVDSYKIQIRHKPIWWPGKMAVYTQDVKQVYVKQKVQRGKNGTTYTYEVRALIKAGNKDLDLKLLSGLPEPQQGLYIEQELEKHLKITDRPVQGEYKG